MKLSNLRLERKNKLENGQSVCLICDVECNFSRTKELYFSVDDKYGINVFGKDNDRDNEGRGRSNWFWIGGEKKVGGEGGEWKWEDIG